MAGSLNSPPVTSGSGKTALVVLCEERHFLEGCWSSWSWLRFLTPQVTLHLLVDGAITTRRKALFESLFPGGIVASLSSELRPSGLPGGLETFVAGNWTARKLAAVYLLQRDQSVLYCDCDVLAFQRPEEIARYIEAAKTPAYLHDEIGYSVDPWFSRRGDSLGLEASPNFNAGLAFVPKACMTEELIRKLLEGWTPELNTHHAEQTLFSLLLRAANAVPLPSSRYVLSWDGVWFWERDALEPDTIARHYTGPVRHRMYLTAYPSIERQYQEQRHENDGPSPRGQSL